MTGQIVYERNGSAIALEDVLGVPILAIEGSKEPVGRIFDSEDGFLSWLSQTPGTERMISCLDKARQIRDTDFIADEERVIEQQQLRMTRTVEDLRALGKRTGLDMGSEEFFLRATRPENPLEHPAFDPLSLCSTPGGSCAVPGVNQLPMGFGFWHDLRYVWPFGDWNDRAVSYRVSGFATVFEDINFGGAALFLTGHPVYTHDLAEWGWANRISSAIVA
jgi:hypothetical protein